MNIKEIIEKPIFVSVSVFLFLLSIFSRSFVGIYIFGFRIGEIIIGLSLGGFIFA